MKKLILSLTLFLIFVYTISSVHALATIETIKNSPEVITSSVEPYLTIDYSTTKIDGGKYSTELNKLPLSTRNKLISELNDIKTNIQKKGALWKADYNPIFLKSDEDRIKLLGLKRKNLPIQEIVKTATNSESQSVSAVSSISLPEYFDWRNQSNKNYITDIRDQGSCGSCWAFGAVAAVEGEARAYYNNPDLNINLSEQDLVSCFRGDGCSGISDSEFPSLFEYFTSNGISDESCFPYTASNEPCSRRCPGWQSGAWKISYYESIPLTIDDIKNAIVTKGPVEVGMIVYNDFFSYSGGIYHHTTDSIAGGHAVTIVGYGVYDGLTYWIVKNSWRKDWGEGGYFRIFAGDSGIDEWFAYAIHSPVPPTPQQVICTDSDSDGYCNWGLGSKPSNCPPCSNSIEDCDDSNSSINTGCGAVSPEITGILNIISIPSGAKVYVTDINTGGYIYRGITPLLIDLNIGERQVKITKEDYHDYYTTVHIEEGKSSNLNIKLMPLLSKITYPRDIGESLEVLPGWKVIEINGSARGYIEEGYDFSHYTLNWCNETMSCNNTGVTLTNGGNSEVIHGTLGSLNLTILPQSGFYFIKLIVFYQDGRRIENSVEVYVDTELEYGFPKELTGGITVADLNNDGKKELIVFTSQIHVLNYNGIELPGFPRSLEFSCDLPFWTINTRILAADLDGDGFKEIVIGDNCGDLHILRYNGSYFPGFPKRIGGWPYGLFDTTIEDVNDDGKPEIIIGGPSTVYMVNISGEEIPGWPKSFYSPSEISGWVTGPFPVADLDGDGFKEIVVSESSRYSRESRGENCRIWVLRHNGSIVEGWPKTLNCVYHDKYNLALGDLNHDGMIEIIATSGSYGFTPLDVRDVGEIHVWNANGFELPGWPIFINSLTFGAPTLSDVDRDGDVEIVVADFYNVLAAPQISHIRVLNYTGSVESIRNTIEPYAMLYGNPTVGNLDEENEIAIGECDGGRCGWTWINGFIPFYVFNHDLTVMKRKLLSGPTFNPNAIITDLDGDGHNELIVSTFLSTNNYLYVWDFKGNSGRTEWSQFYHDERQTGFYFHCNPDGTSTDGLCHVECKASGNCNGARPGEANTCCYGCYYVDVNGDGKIRVDDILLVAQAFGKNEGDPGWNPSADINKDSKVRVDDVLYVAQNFGKDCQ